MSILKADRQLSSKEFSIKKGIRLVGSEDFEYEVLKKKAPVLVMCIRNDSEIEGQVEMVNHVTAKLYGERLHVCLLAEECLGIFSERYKVSGTPTFLIFNDGKETGRLLGQVDGTTLKEFLSKTLA
ncbi:MAG: thioredoxin family protein [Deltaproteobacteria bacterium]|nr:thioredoxin family protein [Deltaproteobacteria bacterium]